MSRGRLCGSIIMLILFGQNSAMSTPLRAHEFERVQPKMKTFAERPKGIRIEQNRRYLSANLLDVDAHYLRPNGDKIVLLAKQDLYAIERDLPAKSIANKGRMLDPRIQFEKGHSLAGFDVIRVNNGMRSSAAFQHLQKLDASNITAVLGSSKKARTIYSNHKGQGDLILTSKLTVKFKAGYGSAADVRKLENRFNLIFERKLAVSGNVYSFSIRASSLTESQQLQLVRSVMNNPNVYWAEPQFVSQPFKTSFEPTSNPLYERQWHLRNTGIGGSRCDTDCDANNAWNIDSDNMGGGDQGIGAVAGEGMVIAIIDDGVQLDHEDLSLWENSGEKGLDGLNNDKRSNGLDDDGNGFIDDWKGWDFVNDPNTSLQNMDATGACLTSVDGQAGPDNDPSPQATSHCLTAEGDDVQQDNHGTAVAGLAAAVGHNSVGVVGTAFRAKILPIRLVSSFDDANSASFCIAAAEAMEYAGRYADVISNSWGMNDVCMALEDAIDNVVAGTIMADDSDDMIDNPTNVSKRKSTDAGAGSPVLFASGNSGSGWVKITVQSLAAGEHAYEWRFLRSAFPSAYDDSNEDDSAWLDDIIWPDGSVEGFENGLTGFSKGLVLNRCDAVCTEFDGLGRPSWAIESNADHVRSGTSSATINASNSDCGNGYLSMLREDPAGDISFWVWVSTNTEKGSDKFEFLVDGKEYLSFGDIAGFVDNSVAYPANYANTIAVGASDSGDLSGTSVASNNSERRIFYSQYGAELDLLAPSGNQHLGITTVDRSGLGDGYNTGSNAADYMDTAYTNSFGGTSASTPIVAGVAAAILAIDPALDAAEVRSILRNTADKIGNVPYDNVGLGRNDFNGYGRVNMFRALQSAAGLTESHPAANCLSPEAFSYTRATDRVLSAFRPLLGSACPSRGPLPETGDICFPIPVGNGKVAVICI